MHHSEHGVPICPLAEIACKVHPGGVPSWVEARNERLVAAGEAADVAGDIKPTPSKPGRRESAILIQSKRSSSPSESRRGA